MYIYHYYVVEENPGEKDITFENNGIEKIIIRYAEILKIGHLSKKLHVILDVKYNTPLPDNTLY